MDDDVSRARLEQDVRRAVYDDCLASGRPPSTTRLADRLSIPVATVRATLESLAAQHVLVLQSSGEILMAMPFSAVPTPFLVETRDYSAFGNCGWDAMGIAAMAGTSATISASCADCGDHLSLRVEDGEIAGPDPLLHFALPARHWWNEVVFT